MIPQAELDLQTAATQAFILADAEDIVLLRRTRSPDGAGGFVFDDEIQIAEQTARLIPQQDKTLEVTGSDGRRATPDWVIMMAPDADLERYDRFDWNGKTWEIAQIRAKPDYERKGDVILVDER